LDARDEGVRVAILFTPQSNLPAQRAYEALGFRHAGHYGLVLLR
jgi:predicted GNAT family acetyltransferase